MRVVETGEERGRALHDCLNESSIRVLCLLQHFSKEKVKVEEEGK